MSKKLSTQSQFDDQSTRVSVAMKSGSIYTNKNRKMYTQQPKTKQQFNHDIIKLQLNYNSSITYPQTIFLDDTSYVTLQDNFYALTDYKGKKQYFSRQAQLNAQLIQFKAFKTINYVYLISTQKCYKTVNNSKLQIIHFNIKKIKQNHQQINHQIYYTLNQISQNQIQTYQFIDLIGIDSYNRGVIALQKKTKNQKSTKYISYQLVLINLSVDNKTIQKIKPQENSKQNLNQQTFSFEQSFIPTKIEQKQIFKNNQIHRIQTPKFFKAINSQFGDMILIVGDQQIHEVQVIQNQKMRLKSLNISRYLQINQKENIVQVKYITNGLRIIILTSANKIIFIESQMLILKQKINQIKNYLLFDDYQKLNQTENLSIYNKFYSIPGALILISRKNNFFDIVKVPDNNGIYFNKRFPIPKFDAERYKFTPLPDSQQLLLQYYEEKTHLLKIEKIQLSSPKSTFIDYLSYKCNFLPKSNIKFSQMSETTRTLIQCQQRCVTAWRFFGDKINKICQTNFFQPPLNISIHPLGVHLILLFKQNVKFCYFQHSQVSVYHTLKIRNVSQAKYVCDGKYILIVDSNMVYLLNSWDFTPFKQFNTYVIDINEVTYFEKDKILVKHGNKNFFYIQGNQRIFQIKLNSHDLSFTDHQKILIIRQTGTIQIYQHADFRFGMDKEKVPKITIANAFKFRLNQYPTCLLPSLQLGFLFLGTNEGYIYQIFWPLHEILDIEMHSIQISSSSILSMKIDSQYSTLYVISAKGNIQSLNLVQIIDGDVMFSPYIFSAATRGEQKQKRQLSGRQCLFNKFTSFALPLKDQLQKSIGQLQFLTQKMKDDLEQQFSKANNQNSEKFNQVSSKNYNTLQGQINDYEKIKKDSLNKQRNLREQIKRLENNYLKTSQQQIENYQKQLLEIYSENERLKGIFNSQNKTLSHEKNYLILQHNQALKNFEKQKYEHLIDLHDKYKQQKIKFENYLKQVDIVNEEQKQQFKLFKKIVEEQVDNQLQHQQNRKQILLGANSTLQKEIQKFRQRAKSFESLIIQTKQQKDELLQDRNDYKEKKKYLQRQLRSKQQLIQSKQEQLQKYVKNTETMKKIKITHQYQLQQNENQLEPIQEKILKIDKDIQKMNGDIMEQYNCKVKSDEKIKIQVLSMDQLKKKKHHITLKNLQGRIKVLRFIQQLTLILNLQEVECKQKLKGLAAGQYTFVDQQKIRIKLEGEKMLKKKVFIRKQLQEQQKRDQQLRKNQYQIIKYQNDNTTLVRQYNELTKLHRQLKVKKNMLDEKLTKLKNQISFKTPKKEERLSRLYSQKKFTPYQRYQQQFIKKGGETTQTKVSRSGHSTSFLQSLLKEVNNSDSKYERMETIRQKVRSFVNPELQLKKTIYMQKIMLDKPRINSQSQRFLSQRQRI